MKAFEYAAPATVEEAVKLLGAPMPRRWRAGPTCSAGPRTT